MKKRKLELALVVAAVAVCSLFLGRVKTEDEKPPEAPVESAARVEPIKLDTPTVNLSEDARWILSTAADSYAPRVPVEKTWVKNDESKSIK